MKLIGITGTNADYSFNRFLLKYMQNIFSDRAKIDLIEIDQLPLFNENNCHNVPASVKEISQQIDDADGVIIATPEYDHAIPAALKSMIEWLSCTSHPFKNKPVMVVGASYGSQGTSRAQTNLKQILDSPGVNALVLSGNEFLLGNCRDEFDANHKLKNKQTIAFLTECFDNYLDFIRKMVPNLTEEETDMNYVDKIAWSTTYDTLVLGFGGAGATAARHAADSGAKVLLVDAAPAGHEGGNTRYAAQILASGDDVPGLKAYYKAMTAPFDLDEKMIDIFVEKMVDFPNYLQNYLDVKPYSFKHSGGQLSAFAKSVISEFPELAGADSTDALTVHNGIFDAALWKIIRQKVLDRSDSIDVWLNSRAMHLIQDPISKVILGAQIERNGKTYNVRANNGVVLTVGGFENNKEQIQDYLGETKLSPLGTLYNRGDGIRMAAEVGAKLWHMHNYEAVGFLHGLAFKVPDGKRARLILDYWPDLYTGSILTIADDATRYFKEDEECRHGHIWDHGTWRIPRANQHPYLIFDQTQLEQIKANKNIPYSDFLDTLVKADSIKQLAQKLNVNSDNLVNTVTDFNLFAEQGKDYEYHRAPESMRKFDNGPFYAAALTHTMLNTQGGPKRNANAEIIGLNGEPVPHLYGAGELGGINTNLYQGGNNLAECLIFGKIAGENAAKPKSDTATSDNHAEPTKVASVAPQNDLAQTNLDDIDLESNQYLGISDQGIGGRVVVRVTYDDSKIKDVEVIEQNESEDFGLKAVEELPKNMVANNTYDVDGISGASASSRALKSAVKNALAKVSE